MPEYDINDPTDVDIIRAKFNMLTADEFEEYIELAEERKMGYKNINILKTGQRKAGIGKYLSPKVIMWILNLTDKLDYEDDDEFEEE